MRLSIDTRLLGDPEMLAMWSGDEPPSITRLRLHNSSLALHAALTGNENGTRLQNVVAVTLQIFNIDPYSRDARQPQPQPARL